MATYTYKGMDRTGKEVKGSLAADNLATAKSKVKAMGVMLLGIQEEKSKSGKKQSSFTFGSPIKVEDLALMTRQLATLIKARIQIVEALAALEDQMENATMKLVLSEVKQKVNEGVSLAKALSEYPKIFNNVYVNMVEAGEASGTLDIVLIRLADFTESQVKLSNKIKGAMTYPIIMAVMGFLMMMLIFTLVIPKLAKIFTTMKKELPLQTKLCIWISEVSREYWMFIIPAPFVAYYLFRKYIQTKRGELRWHRTILRLPLVGQLSTMINVSRFCSTLATLLNSGVPILVAMKIVKNLVSNVHIKNSVEVARTSVQEGASMAAPLKESGLFPPLVTHMIKLGEKSGELEPMLQIVSENYENQVETKLQGLTSILEPIMMIAMGIVVGFVVFSVVVPMMELNTLK